MKLSSGQRFAVIVTALLAACAISFCGGFFASSAANSGKSRSYTVLTAEESAEPPSLPEASQSGGAPELYIDINLAKAEELTALDGIGEKLAERIVEYRLANGPFQHRYDIMNVSGIGNGIYEKIKNNIYVR